MRMMRQSEEEGLRGADEEYIKHLEEIKIKEELVRKKEKEWCEMEYKRYNEQYLKSSANYETYLAKKREIDKATSENLTSLERKIAEGYNRSIERKEEIKRLAACSLSKVGEVIEN